MRKMLTVTVIFLVVLGITALTQTSLGRKKNMTSENVLVSVSTTLEKARQLDLKQVSCKPLYGDESLEGTKCYASPVPQDELAKQLAETLTPLADTRGWTTDYSIPGAFYQMKGDPDMTFGITVKGIQDSTLLKEVPELKAHESYVTLTVNEERTP